ncbi:MAG: hypothetical protein R6U37_00110 [Dehalococcoidia bacterium]
MTFEAAEDNLMLGGKTASVMIEGTTVGILGELHPDAVGRFDISAEPVCLFELEIEKLVSFSERLRTFQPIPRYPSTDRDLALVVDDDITTRKIQDIISSFPQVSSATLFDVYQGKQIPPGKKSLAFALRYQSPERTLTDEEVDEVQRKILTRLEKEVGSTLRQ